MSYIPFLKLVNREVFKSVSKVIVDEWHKTIKEKGGKWQNCFMTHSVIVFTIPVDSRNMSECIKIETK